MLLWTEDELEGFLNIMLKISANITSNPAEAKFQKLKFGNKVVSEKINARSCGMDFMLAIGFDVIEDEGENGAEKVYVLRPDGFQSIESSMDWLRETIGVCQGLIEKKKNTKSPSSSAPLYAAACLLQIKLPNNKTVQGGFMSTDCVEDVTRFVQHYFREERQSQVELRLAHVAGALSPDSSLSELHLLPRATLVASTLTSTDRDAAFKQAHVQAVEQEVEKVVYKQKSREEKKQEQEQRQKHKADILRAFREDHDT